MLIHEQGIYNMIPEHVVESEVKKVLKYTPPPHETYPYPHTRHANIDIRPGQVEEHMSLPKDLPMVKLEEAEQQNK